MGLFKFLGSLSPAHISFFTFVTSKKYIGEDQYGNKYYEADPRKGYKLTRRWVFYKDEQEATTVPPEWHGWLHHQNDHVPDNNEEYYRRPWQKPHEPNRTGTNEAYRPPGHILEGGNREKATGDYEAWNPND